MIKSINKNIILINYVILNNYYINKIINIIKMKLN
jgi:hypothetical protein